MSNEIKCLAYALLAVIIIALPGLLLGLAAGFLMVVEARP